MKENLFIPPLLQLWGDQKYKKTNAGELEVKNIYWKVENILVPPCKFANYMVDSTYNIYYQGKIILGSNIFNSGVVGVFVDNSWHLTIETHVDVNTSFLVHKNEQWTLKAVYNYKGQDVYISTNGIVYSNKDVWLIPLNDVYYDISAGQFIHRNDTNFEIIGQQEWMEVESINYARNTMVINGTELTYISESKETLSLLEVDGFFISGNWTLLSPYKTFNYENGIFTECENHYYIKNDKKVIVMDGLLEYMIPTQIEEEVCIITIWKIELRYIKDSPNYLKITDGWDYIWWYHPYIYKQDNYHLNPVENSYYSDSDEKVITIDDPDIIEVIWKKDWMKVKSINFIAQTIEFENKLNNQLNALLCFEMNEGKISLIKKDDCFIDDRCALVSYADNKFSYKQPISNTDREYSSNIMNSREERMEDVIEF